MLEVSFTTSFPVIVPEIRMTFDVAVPAAAALSSSRVVTMTGAAEPPPVVLV